MLEKLAEKDKLWRSIAYRITNNKDSADELVQNMYLRVLDYDVDTAKLTNVFVKVVLYNLFKDSKKNIYNTISIEDVNLEKNVTNNEDFSYSDEDLTLLKKINKLSKYEKDILALNYDLSYRKIADIKEVCYVKVSRDLCWARIKVLKSKYKK